MNLLLDTHTSLWFFQGAKRLPKHSLRAITECTGDVFVSMASAWEIAIKKSLGKLTFPDPLEDVFRHACDESGFRILNIELQHLQLVAELPFEHRDPFDRLLAAQALSEKLSFVSADPVFEKYAIERIWN